MDFSPPICRKVLCKGPSVRKWAVMRESELIIAGESGVLIPAPLTSGLGQMWGAPLLLGLGVGVSSMSVKEVLQSLVDDSMVDCERIGTSNYYWAFPSKALHAKKRKLETLKSQLSEGSQKHASLQKSIEKAKIGRYETEERTMLAKELSSLRDQREQLKAEVEKYKDCDPQVVEEIRQANKVAKEAANRWTDNIFAIKSWAKRKFGFEENKIDKTFGIPEDFDYID
uniref:meiotic nuclear division protein 1 homolog n=1 Tax=Callithrix jacchus TaxID=9483 RepID=UPI0023DD12E8|nr:meiotic nuclear division protein 1 homolog [Callithrix jacchus]